MKSKLNQHILLKIYSWMTTASNCVTHEFASPNKCVHKCVHVFCLYSFHEYYLFEIYSHSWMKHFCTVLLYFNVWLFHDVRISHVVGPLAWTALTLVIRMCHLVQQPGPARLPPSPTYLCHMCSCWAGFCSPSWVNPLPPSALWAY